VRKETGVTFCWMVVLAVLVALPLSAQHPDDLYRHPLQQAIKTSQVAITALEVTDSVIELEAGEAVHFSGVIPSKRSVLSKEAQAIYQADKDILQGGTEKPLSSSSPQRVGESLQELLRAGSTTPFVVHVYLQAPAEVDWASHIQGDLLAGKIRTVSDYQRSRLAHLKERQADIRKLQDSLLPSLAALGATITYRCEVFYCLDILISPSKIEPLLRNELIARIDGEQYETEDADIAGRLIIAGTQIKQFIDDSYDGENTGIPDISVGIVESSDFNDEHPAFKDSTSSLVRIEGKFSCNSSPCTSVSSFPAPADHATGVAGIIIGDLRDGQDPAHTSTNARIDRSGYAGEARGYLYTTGGTVDGTLSAYGHITNLASPPRIINRSGGFLGDDPQCLGESALNRVANDLFEQGILLIKTAGNEGHSSSTDCTVNSPGAAIGVFTVGGHGNSTTGAESDVRSGSIYSNSSRGGTVSEGKGRTIVDITAFAARKLMPDANGGYSYNAPGTSFSAPTVTAGAIDFIDFYKKNQSDLIDDPGILFANLLLMGDREGEGGELSSGFDNLWGAGRFKMRKFDSEGMDSPYQWKTGRVCVGQGEAVTIAVNDGSAISSSANDFKAVIYWYDRRHESGTAIDDIDLRLKNSSGSTLVSSTSMTDNKERVYHSAVGGATLELEIYGQSVASDVEGCGTNSMRVFYAFFYEDDARNDSNGPGSEIETE
jgi:hypothetical protein